MLRQILILQWLLFCIFSSAQIEKTEVLLLMGSRFEITVLAENDTKANEAIHLAKAEITRIEKIISSWDTNSETSKINKNAGIKPVHVSHELFKLIENSLQISTLTHGAFDISAASISQFWDFNGEMNELPSSDKIAELKKLINYQNIKLDKEIKSVFLKEKGMRIGFGSIGKGYAAQKASKLLQDQGIESGLINAGGDLYAWGTQANGKDWQVAIADPQDKHKAKSWLSIKNQAIVTSGDYEKRVLIDGKYYSHIIDPRTGMPVENNLRSVSVIASNAEFADAMATALFVLGSKTGLFIVDQLPDVEALFITNEGDFIFSKNIQLNSVEL